MPDLGGLRLFEELADEEIYYSDDDEGFDEPDTPLPDESNMAIDFVDHQVAPLNVLQDLNNNNTDMLSCSIDLPQVPLECIDRQQLPEIDPNMFDDQFMDAC